MFTITFCTCPNKTVARDIADQLVYKKFAACVNISSEIESIYTWESKIEVATEFLLIIKSTAANYKAIEDCIKSIHPYDCPEIISIPIQQGLPTYLKWLEITVKSI